MLHIWMVAGKVAVAKGLVTGVWTTLCLYAVSFFSGMFIYAFIRTIVLLIMGVGKAPKQPKKNGKILDVEATVK